MEHTAELDGLLQNLAQPIKAPSEGAKTMGGGRKTAVADLEMSPGGGLKIGKGALEWMNAGRLAILGATFLGYMVINDMGVPLTTAIVKTLASMADSQTTLAETLKVSAVEKQDTKEDKRRMFVVMEASVEANHSVRDELRNLIEFLKRK